MEQYFDVAVAGIPLLFVVMGLVEWVRQFGVSGNWLRVTSMIVGLVLGMGYQVSQGMPATFAAWFAAAVYGLALGVVASGVRDALKQALGRGETVIHVAGTERNIE